MASGGFWDTANRLGGLRRFATAISILNLLGHFYLGFEQSYAQPLVGLSAAYLTELILELVGCYFSGKKPAFLGSKTKFVDFFLSAHISGLAVSMLTYTNERLWVTAFAASSAIASKWIFRVSVDKGTRHFFNPSNIGITITLLLFPWVGIAQPYMFTESMTGAGDWVLPGIIICSGTFLNWRFTHRLPLIAAWLSCFLLQATVRHFFFDANFQAALMPMTGVAFILYTFYMVTDPATTPNGLKSQIAFGGGVALVYGLLMVVHVVFGLFFALSIVCALRGLGMWAISLAAQKKAQVVQQPEPVRQAAMVGGD